MKLNSKKNIFFIILILFTSINYSQEIKLTDNITFNIKKIKYKRTTRGGQGWVVSPKGYKYLILDVDFYGKSGKKEKLPLFEMKFETKKEKYKVRPFPDVGPEYVKGFYHKVRKKKNRNLYIVVDDDFKEGVLSFKGRNILKVSVEKDSKRGTFKLIDE